MPRAPSIRRKVAARPAARARAAAATGAGAAGTAAPAERSREKRVAGSARYRSIGVIGEGSFGRIVRVHDSRLDRELAMKVLKPRRGFEQRDLRRFIAEARATARLEHPNIVPIHDLGGDPEPDHYTMKLIRGRTLREVLVALKEGDREATREWSLTRLVQVFLQICHAVAFAHSRGVIHRDLKPENVMLGDYGEVILMDWGLAKVMDEGSPREAAPAHATVEGSILGSPAYMAPEQAAGETDKIDARSDVWSLGVILYELLTLTPPFVAGNGAWLLAKILMATPEPPRQRAAERDIPLELTRICLQALSKEREKRQPDAPALRAEVQGWLEAELERSRRHDLAEAKAREGVALVRRYRELQQQVAAGERSLARLGLEFNSWQPLTEKRALLDARHEQEEAARSLDRCFGDAVALLTTAVGIEAENRTARQALAEIYWDKFLTAEAAADERSTAYFRPLVELYHDGRYQRELAGEGALSLESNPGGAEVWLYDYQEEDCRLVARNERLLGSTPLKPCPLPMGSYLAILRKAGYRDTRYPLRITRNGEWVETVSLYRDEEIGPDMVYVPGGPFEQGGDPDPLTWSLPRTMPVVGDFFIAVHPVTMNEYLEFINALARTRPEQALRRAPRRYHEGGIYLAQKPDGSFRLPDVDDEGDRWLARWPVVGVSWDDARAYCAWRGQRDGRAYRLPTDSEWEKAARGVDGRWYPWGSRFDSSLSNMKGSRRERPAPVSVDEFPTDRSPYEVRGLAGNVRDWTENAEDSGEGEAIRDYRVVRGGCWGFGPTGLRASFRFGVSPTLVDGQIGFRLACSAPVAGPRSD